MSSDTSNFKSIIEKLSGDLNAQPAFFEKDWYSMRIISLLDELDDPNLQLVFSGGTSLSKGFGLVQRFSEDLDFKVGMKETPTRSQRSAFRKALLSKLEEKSSEWQIELGNTLVGNASKFFRIPIFYPVQFEATEKLREFIQLEVTFEPPAIAPEMRPLQSFVSMAQKQTPEAKAFPCVSPLETAANKLSALTWRVLSRDRSSKKDDPTLIRHLHDLAELKDTVQDSDVFKQLVLESLEKDVSRAQYAEASASPQDQLKALENVLRGDSAYQDEYQQFVFNMSYADDAPSFEQSLSGLGTLIEVVSAYSKRHTQTKQGTGVGTSKTFLSPSMQAEAQRFLDSYLEEAIKSLIANMDRASDILEVDSSGTKSFRGKDFLWSLNADDSVSLTRISDGTEITPQTVTGPEMNTIRTFVVKCHEKYLQNQPKLNSDNNPPTQGQEPQKPKL